MGCEDCSFSDSIPVLGMPLMNVNQLIQEALQFVGGAIELVEKREPSAYFRDQTLSSLRDSRKYLEQALQIEDDTKRATQ